MNRKTAPRDERVDTTDGESTKRPAPPWGTIIVVSSVAVILLAVIIEALIAHGDKDAVTAAQEPSTFSAETTTTKPINYDAAETSASLYCFDAPLHDYEKDWETIHDECVDFVLSEIRSDEERFRNASPSGDSSYGRIREAAIQTVLGDPEEFLEEHGYATTTTTTTTRTSTRKSSPTSERTYQQPEPSVPAPSSGGSSSSSSSDGDDYYYEPV